MLLDRSPLELLSALGSDDILELGMVVSTPEALAVLLKRRPEVLELRRTLDRGSLTLGQLRHFVANVVQRFEPGKKFVGDVTLCALAVALESHASRFAEDYLRELSCLQLGELPMSPRVARVALRSRARLLSGTTVSRFKLSEPKHHPHARVRESTIHRVTSIQLHFSHKLAA